VTRTEGAFDCTRPLRLVARSNASEQEQAALRTFAADLEHLLGTRPDVHMDDGATRDRPVAWLTADAAPSRWEPSIGGGWNTKPEGYTIEMRPDAIAMAGADQRGLWYGTRMAYQIVANACDDRPLAPRAPCLAITNWPDHRIRGLHLPLKINTDFELLASLMKCLALYHHNLLVIEVHDAVRYDQQPLGSAPHAYEKHVVRHLVGRSVGMGGIQFSSLDTGEAIALRGAWEPNVRAPSRVDGVVVGRLARALLFLHTCGWETPRGTPVARYSIHFGDGTDQTVDILYGRDILAFDSKSFIYEKLDRQAARLSIIGRTRLGRAVRFHALRWENPRPTVRIESVDLESLGTVAAPMVLAIATESR